ncbi:MAG: YceI family protein [bacterium]|nr:YceI family protein [bacterium]
MRTLVKISVWAGVAIVTVATAAFLWWIDNGPEAVDLETAVVQLEATSNDGVDGSSATQPSENSGMTSTTGPDDELSTSLGIDAETVNTTAAVDAPGDSPDLPTTDEALPTDSVHTTGTTSTDTPQVAEPADDAPSPDTGATETTSAGPDPEAFAGFWFLATPESADGLPGEPAVSFAGFRVVEVLAGGVAESTAVGRTADLAGSIELAGANLVAARVEVNMATLRTDNSHRDSHMRQALNTREYPLAVFTLIEPVELPVGVFEGGTFSGTAHGELTIKGVANRAAFDLKARLVGDTIVVAGSSEVVFGDYGVPTPTSASVISVEDQGIMEFLLYFAR